MKIIQEQLDINYTRKCFMDILELIRIVRMRTPAIRPVGLILIQIVKKTMAVKALKGQYVALLVQSLPHCTTSTNPLLRLNSLIQQTDTRYFSTREGYIPQILTILLEIPPRETSPAAKSEEKRMFSQAKT